MKESYLPLEHVAKEDRVVCLECSVKWQQEAVKLFGTGVLWLFVGCLTSQQRACISKVPDQNGVSQA